MVVRFQEDTNTTAIAYKKYGYTFEDIYPSLSICLEGAELYRFNESAIFAGYGIYLTEYIKMLNGKNAFKYSYDPTIRMYHQYSLPPRFKPSVSHEARNLFQIPHIVKSANLVTENPKHSLYLGDTHETQIRLTSLGLTSDIAENAPFYVGYQSSTFFCFTRESNGISNFIRLYDSVILDTALLDEFTSMKIILHYPGQLLRSWDSPSLTSDLGDSWNKIVGLNVLKTTVLRKRSAKKAFCNKNIGNHDLFLLMKISEELKCIPPYWINIVNQRFGFEECIFPEDLKKANNLRKNYKMILNHTDSPCIDMFNTVSIRTPRACEKCIEIKVSYLDKYYEEIKEIKAFGFQDFISGLGGFIGIFLGYSMMQIPRLLGM